MILDDCEATNDNAKHTSYWLYYKFALNENTHKKNNEIPKCIKPKNFF